MKKKYLGIMLILSAALCLAACGKDKVDKYAYREQGIIHLDAGSYTEAITAFDDAIAHSTGFVGRFELDVLKYRAEAEYQNGDYQDAIDTYTALLKADKERAEYYYMRCSAYASHGQMEAAVADYDNASKLDEKSAEKSSGVELALLSLGTIYEKSEDYDKAMSLYNQAVAAGMQNGEIYNRMGLCKFNEGAYEEALSYFELGRQLGDEESLPRLIYNMGVTYEYMGDYKNALQSLTDYRESYGGDEVTDKELAFLKTRVFGDAQQTGQTEPQSTAEETTAENTTAENTEGTSQVAD